MSTIPILLVFSKHQNAGFGTALFVTNVQVYQPAPFYIVHYQVVTRYMKKLSHQLPKLSDLHLLEEAQNTLFDHTTIRLLKKPKNSNENETKAAIQ